MGTWALALNIFWIFFKSYMCNVLDGKDQVHLLIEIKSCINWNKIMYYCEDYRKKNIHKLSFDVIIAINYTVAYVDTYGTPI